MECVAREGYFCTSLRPMTAPIPSPLPSPMGGFFAQPYRRRIPGQIMCAAPLHRPSGFRLSPE